MFEPRRDEFICRCGARIITTLKRKTDSSLDLFAFCHNCKDAFFITKKFKNAIPPTMLNSNPGCQIICSSCRKIIQLFFNHRERTDKKILDIFEGYCYDCNIYYRVMHPVYNAEHEKSWAGQNNNRKEVTPELEDIVRNADQFCEEEDDGNEDRPGG